MPFDILPEIEAALGAIEPEYCRLSPLDYHYGDPRGVHMEKFLERPISYEFYHQLRARMVRWPANIRFRLQGEVDKRYQGIARIPDFLVHSPGQTDQNIAAIEFKRSAAPLDEILDDQTKLRHFLERPLNYEYSVQAIVGSAPSLRPVVDALIASRENAGKEVLFAFDVEQRQVSRH
jgi:hypothetical protein